MFYFILKRLFSTLLHHKIWFLIPLGLMLLKVVIGFFQVPERYEILLPVKIAVEETMVEGQKVQAEDLRQVLSEVLNRDHQFVFNRVGVMPQSLLDRFLMKASENRHIPTVSSSGSNHQAKQLMGDVITLVLDDPFNPGVLYKGYDEELGVELVKFFAGELANYIKLKTIQSSFLLEDKISELEQDLNRQVKNLEVPGLSLNRKRFYEQRKEEIQIRLNLLQSKDAQFKALSGGLKVTLVDPEVDQVVKWNEVLSWLDLYLLILLLVLTAGIVVVMEFGRQGFTSETQMIRYLKVDLIGSIPKADPLPKPKGD